METDFRSRPGSKHGFQICLRCQTVPTGGGMPRQKCLLHSSVVPRSRCYPVARPGQQPTIIILLPCITSNFPNSVAAGRLVHEYSWETGSEHIRVMTVFMVAPAFLGS